MATQTDFYRQELANALKENSYGIQHHALELASTSSSSTEARATVKLLEDRTVVIRLDASGYRVVDGGQDEDQVRETLDDLLSALSSEYVAKRDDYILRRLQHLQQSLHPNY